jgi:hypothetical protein
MTVHPPVTSTQRPRRSRRRLSLIYVAVALAIVVPGAIGRARADVAPHLHNLAIASVPPDAFSARVVHYPTNNQFARNSVTSECFGGLQPGKKYLFPDSFVIADDNNNARQNSVKYNATIQGFSDSQCGTKSVYCQFLVRTNEIKYWWVDENAKWYTNFN